MSSSNTIGDFRFGLKSEEDHARFTESLYREAESMSELGEVPAGTTFLDIANTLIDTFFGYSSMDSITATELPTLISDALEQMAGHFEGEVFQDGEV
jgi:hypothetical protein